MCVSMPLCVYAHMGVDVYRGKRLTVVAFHSSGTIDLVLATWVVSSLILILCLEMESLTN